MSKLYWLAAVGAAVVTPAAAQVAMSGDFKAAQACPAVQSIRRETNPGNVHLTPGQTYPVIAKNRADATHYLVTIEGASPAQRWVAVSCGAVAGAATPAAGGAEPGDGTYLLVLSWEPAFCDEHGDKAECQRETEHSADASQFSLHGLWPQPNGTFYCGVDSSLKAADRHSQWWSLPEPQISAATQARLGAVMPGLLSGLERHEWIRHGTCYGGDADGYFNREAGLAETVNGSPVRALFASRIGQSVTADEIRAAFDQGFGVGAGARVQIHCQGQGDEREISELWINLSGDVKGAAPLASLIAAGSPWDAQCPSGKVADAAR